MGVAFYVGGQTFYVPVAHDSWMTPDTKNLTLPSDLLEDLGAPLVFHNAKFDFHVLKKLGIRIPDNLDFYDTMLMRHYINENEFDFSLESMAKKYVGEGKEKELSRVMSKEMKWEETPAFAMAKYAEVDCRRTYELYHASIGAFETYRAVWEIDRKFLLLLLDMEEKGLQMDTEKCLSLKKMCEDRLEKIQEELGFNPNKQKELHERLFSPPPLGYGLKVLSRTAKTNKPQVNRTFMERTNHPVCGLLLEHSELKKQLTSYYNSYLKLTEGYGRVHPSYKQHGTVSGRLSCADPNMQQLPRDSPIKSLFLPEPGYELWEIDFRNIELRLAAVYSKDPNLLEIFKAEGDVHQLTADLVGISRQDAKMVNFLVTFLGGAELLASKLNKPVSVTTRFVKGFKESYPRIFATARAAEEAVENNGGWIKLWSGRRRHFKWPSEYRTAWNAIIQGGSFEIVKRAMLRLQNEGFDIRNQVHDSVWLMIPTGKSGELIPKAESIMADWTEEMFGLKFSVDSKRLS